MAVYAIGDIQGCYDELRTLLKQCGFRDDVDQLWLVGDLVNRGPRSLEVLRLVRGLGDNAVAVLGNHDLHLLAAAAGLRNPGRGDTFDEILAAPDCDSLLEWLRGLPLMHHDPAIGCAMVHAGLVPQWTIADALECAAEVEAVLRSDGYRAFLAAMYGDQPDLWRDDLEGVDRLRFILNCFTRLRFCDRAGRMHLREKGTPWQRDDGLLPWFEVPGRASAGTGLVFGHWSVLGRYQAPDIYALDTGCIWGGTLTALRIDGERRDWFSVPCEGYCRPGEY